MLNHANTMQIRSSAVTEIIYDRIQFEDGLPISGGDTMSVSDRPPSFLHHHNALEIGYCYDGYGVFMIGHEVYNFGPGDVSVINAGVPHIARSSHADGSKWAFVSIDPYTFASSFTYDLDVQICSPACRAVLHESEVPDISTITKDFFAELQAHRECYKACATGLLIALLCKICRLEPNEHGMQPVFATTLFAHISPALRMIAQCYSNNVTVAEMARVCCISEPQLRRNFIRAVGQSPVAYLTRFRLGIAMSLLENSELSIIQIANDVGYSSPSTFYRHFLAEFGKSPRDWRKERRSDIF